MYQGWLFTLLNTSVYLVRGGAVVTSDYRGPPDGVGFSMVALMLCVITVLWPFGLLTLV